MKEAWERLLAELRRLWDTLVELGYVDWAIYLVKQALARPST